LAKSFAKIIEWRRVTGELREKNGGTLDGLDENSW